jgi:hypothetical protein
MTTPLALLATFRAVTVMAPVCVQSMSEVAQRASSRLTTPPMMSITWTWIGVLMTTADTLPVDELQLRVLLQLWGHHHYLRYQYREHQFHHCGRHLGCRRRRDH